MRSDAADGFNVLEMFDVEASDEALFGNLNWIQNNADDTIIRRETDPNGPIGQLPAEILAELDGFYADAVAGGRCCGHGMVFRCRPARR